eukprot:2997147-Pleurochrysis_carterae.AAC.1
MSGKKRDLQTAKGTQDCQGNSRLPRELQTAKATPDCLPRLVRAQMRCSSDRSNEGNMDCKHAQRTPDWLWGLQPAILAAL